MDFKFSTLLRNEDGRFKLKKKIRNFFFFERTLISLENLKQQKVLVVQP